MNEAAPANPEPLEGILWAVFFGMLGGVWMLFNWLIAKNGWAKVARQFPAVRPIEGSRFRSCSGSFGAASYTNAIHTVVGPSGIYLYSPWLFRYAHPPLLLTWDKVKDVTEFERLWIKMIELKLEAAEVPITLWLPVTARELLRDVKGKALVP